MINDLRESKRFYINRKKKTEKFGLRENSFKILPQKHFKSTFHYFRRRCLREMIHMLLEIEKLTLSGLLSFITCVFMGQQ